MQSSMRSFVVALVLVLACAPAWAEDSWTEEQQEVLAAMERLSAATAPDGAGPDAYAEVWVRRDGARLLLRVDISVLDSP